MEKFNLPYTIKPKIYNKGLFIVIAIMAAFSIFTFINYRDIVVTSMTIFTLFLMTVFVLLYLRRIIILEEESLRYKGVLINISIRYSDIYDLDFAATKTKGNKLYFLIVKANRDLVIKNIQLYKKEEIAFLLNLIAKVNAKLPCEKNISLLDGIKWVK